MKNPIQNHTMELLNTEDITTYALVIGVLKTIIMNLEVFHFNK